MTTTAGDPSVGPVGPAPDGAAGATTTRRSRTPRAPGEPVVLPSSLSPSRASDFMTCPLLYRFRVVDRLPEPPSLAASRGTLVHAVLERLFDLPAASRTLAEARALVGPEWERLLADEPELVELVSGDDGAAPMLDGAADLLGRYFELEDPTRLEPAERELLVETELADGLVLRGYVDRLDVAPDGAVRVVDYKTGRAPDARFEQKALFQMRFYALVLWRTTGVVPRLLQLLYLGSGDVLRHTPDEADLLAVERKVAALWTAVRTAAESGDWRPRRSRLCDWCAHQEICPEFGGTPPPLPAVTVGPPRASDPTTAPDRAPEDPL